MIRYDCRYFRAARPCVFNKQDGSECPSCRHVSPYRERVLFIKLDAMGDVLRSASLLPAIVARHEAPFVAWLTRPEAAELVSLFALVDEVIPLAPETPARLAAGGWTQVYSLSNDLPSAALASMAAAARPPVGFSLRAGVLTPSNAAAEAWLELAAFDRLKRANTQSYQERMLAIIGAPGPVARPALRWKALPVAEAARRVAALLPAGRRPRVAINLGAGARWPKKMLDAEQIVTVVHALRARADCDVLLVGGGAERDKAEAVRTRCDPRHVATALTPASVAEFIAVLMQADLLLCGDTLALHVAGAIGLPTVCVFGPTSRAEIASYDGLIDKVWAEPLDCLGCYGDCDKAANCMALLDPEALAARLLARLPAGVAVPTP